MDWLSTNLSRLDPAFRERQAEEVRRRDLVAQHERFVAEEVFSRRQDLRTTLASAPSSFAGLDAVHAAAKQPTHPRVVADMRVAEVTLPDDHESVGVACPICLSPFAVGDGVVQWPCESKHRFHTACVRTWCSRANTCPICRYEVPCFEDTQFVSSMLSQALYREHNFG